MNETNFPPKIPTNCNPLATDILLIPQIFPVRDYWLIRCTSNPDLYLFPLRNQAHEDRYPSQRSSQNKHGMQTLHIWQHHTRDSRGRQRLSELRGAKSNHHLRVDIRNIDLQVLNKLIRKYRLCGRDEERSAHHLENCLSSIQPLAVLVVGYLQRLMAV